MWAFFSKSGLISYCNDFDGRLYGADMAFGSSQHERRHRYPEIPFPYKQRQALCMLLALLSSQFCPVQHQVLSGVGAMEEYILMMKSIS